MRARNIVMTLSVVLLALAAQARASTITYAGFVEGAEVTDWRTSTTAKTMDLDGDNVYGSMGGSNLSGTESSAPGQTTHGSTTFGWVGLAMQDNYYGGNSNYASVDNHAGTGKTYPGLYYGNPPNPGTFTFELTGQAADYAGKKVRVGFMQDVLGTGAAGDTGKSLELAQMVGGTGDSPVVSLRSGGAGDGVPEMYFFDITGVNPGDQFKIVASTSGGTGYVSGFSFDIEPVPEPSTVALLATGLLSLLAYAWRKRK